jgi:hypothetical protein
MYLRLLNFTHFYVFLYHKEMSVLKKQFTFVFAVDETYAEERGSTVPSVTLLHRPLYTKLHFHCPKYQKNSSGSFGFQNDKINIFQIYDATKLLFFFFCSPEAGIQF